MNKPPTCPKCGKRMMHGGRAPSGRIRWICKTRPGGGAMQVFCYTTTDSKAAHVLNQRGDRVEQKKTPILRRKQKPGRRKFVITTAQNATGVHTGFLKSLEGYCNVNSAELFVIPIRYKNPTSVWTASQRNEEVWADAVQPYLLANRIRLNKNLAILADVKTQPTAVSPLTGFESLTAGESCILGHTKLQLKTVATPQNKMPKLLTTTGACTLPNYSDTKTGAQGEFHHSLAAIVVEIDDTHFHLRQLNAEKTSGAFYDLNKGYTPTGMGKAPRAAALVLGDTHVDFADPEVLEATYGKGGMIEVFDPEHVIYHDLLDGYTFNPHHFGNPFNSIAKVANGRADGRAEVERALEYLAAHTNARVVSIVVPSNHDDFLTRWIISEDWKTMPGNAEFYLETALAMVRGTKLTTSGTEFPSPFPYWGERRFDSKFIRFLKRDESFALRGIELGMHGDKGPNGARGSIRNLRRIGTKSIIGHTHSPGIDEGCYQVGTSTRLRLEYNIGPSSWMNTHAVVYANGKRSLINIVDGDWHI